MKLNSKGDESTQRIFSEKLFFSGTVSHHKLLKSYTKYALIGDYFNKALGSRKERKWKPKKKTSRKGKGIPSKRKGGGRKAAIIKINQLQTTVMMRSYTKHLNLNLKCLIQE